MDVELDCELSPDQWEMLKALRSPAPDRRTTSRPVLAELTALGLVAFNDERPVITAKGRKVLVRGSEKLLDVAA
jgi:ribosomal protein S19E (S16A)